MQDKNKVTEPKKIEALPTHRYYCDACSNTAFLWNKNEAMPKNGVCRVCGRSFKVKEANFIKLS